jgi:hypothetical protein
MRVSLRRRGVMRSSHKPRSPGRRYHVLIVADRRVESELWRLGAQCDPQSAKVRCQVAAGRIKSLSTGGIDAGRRDPRQNRLIRYHVSLTDLRCASSSSPRSAIRLYAGPVPGVER